VCERCELSLEELVHAAVDQAAAHQLALGVEPGSTPLSTRALRAAASEAMAAYAVQHGLRELEGAGMLGAFVMKLEGENFSVRWIAPPPEQRN